jgi:NADP-dependent 3-hydroxy acid dehydrogenase YdfG
MAERLKGKVALVFGAGSVGPGWGNGKATAVLFAREGARVIAVDRNEAAARETAAIIDGEGHACLALAGDVTRSDSVEAVVARAVKEFGRIDILHNNVGVAELGGPIETSEASWRRVLDVNLTGMFLTCKHTLPVMQAQRAGAIVNISSIAAVRYTGVPYVGYSASKGGVNHAHGRAGAAARRRGYPRQRHHAGPDGHADDPSADRRPLRRRRRHGGGAQRAVPDGLHGDRLGRRAGRRVPRLGRGALHHRRLPAGRRRHQLPNGLNAAPATPRRRHFAAVGAVFGVALRITWASSWAMQS